MSNKQQLCISFKNNKEETMMYQYINSLSDKSIFIKSLIRTYLNDDDKNIPIYIPPQNNLNNNLLIQQDELPKIKEVKETLPSISIKQGKNTMSKFLS